LDLTSLELEGLLPDLRGAERSQVSHGLNLVLKLKDPLRMPLLLAAIRRKQRKINAGLGELNFVHFARFLPTHDHSALQVITEFDGPLAPYVLDFIIEIGDVFDMLLSFTQGTASIVPVAEHPAEFLAFVTEHNSVTVLGQMVPDWPLYAAYPEDTVLDITGPRDDLPIPKTDRWATPVALHDVQGNILRGYSADRVRHFLLRVVDAVLARAWLVDKATPGAPGPFPGITSAAPWSVAAPPTLMLNVGLTHVGLDALGIRQAWSATLPVAFREGALARAPANVDVATNEPTDWWLGGPQQAPHLHAMVSLYGKQATPAAFDAAAQALSASLAANGWQLLAAHDAVRRNGQSWFGYADSIANPRIATVCPAPASHDDLQPAATAGEFVLGRDCKNVYGGTALGKLPADLAGNGSFCAVRVLAQDTTAFDATLTAEAARLGQSRGWLAAKLMGRWFDGAPSSLHPLVDPANPAENSRNDFDYGPSYEYPATANDHGGERCPVGAHIRRVNPRSSRVAGARYSRRVMRRGMHYEITDGAGTRVEVGLFGMFFCADLERQFEFIQREWINGDRFAAGLRGTRDPIIGTAIGSSDSFEIPMTGTPSLEIRLPQFVRTRGSVYLFVPGLNALRGLPTFATVDPMPVALPVTPPLTPPHPVTVALDALRAVLNPLGFTLTDTDLVAMARASLGGIGPVGTSATRGSSRPLAFDPRRRAFQLDPYPVYKAFRTADPVHYSPLYDGWFVFGYDNVRRVLTENGNFSAAPPGAPAARSMFTLDPPQHTGVRAIFAAEWAAAAGNTAALVTQSITSALAAIGARPCFDLVDDFARPVPRDVYFDILGGATISAADRLLLDGLARRVMKHHDRLLDDLERLDGTLAGLELTIRMATMLVAASVTFRRQTFLQRLAPHLTWFGGTLDPMVAVSTLVNLTVAGYMSVEFLLATGIRRLLLDGAAGWVAIGANPTLLPQYLREMRRTEHALSVVDRFAKVDVPMTGAAGSQVVIPQGARVFGVLASANRDEAIYGANADQFNPMRPFPQPSLAFGGGAHDCMGRMLESLINEPAILRLVAAMPALRLQAPAEPARFENFYFRSFDHLAVTLT